MNIAEQGAVVAAGLAARDKDPLGYWRFAVEQCKEALGLFTAAEPIEELHIRAANKAAKTETAAAFVLAAVQKRKSLDGVPIPQWRGPVSAKVLSLDYTEQKLNIQPAILRLLGNWPHKATNKGDGIIGTLKIMPEGGTDDESRWSDMIFQTQENKRAGVGRADIVLADEPPDMGIWNEARKAAHAGRKSLRIIAETPTIRRLWAPLKEQYGDPPRDRLTRTNQDWAEIRWSLVDEAGNPTNRALTRREVDTLIRQYEAAKDGLLKARIYGDYVDTSGLCPFDIVTLQDMLKWAEAQTIETHKWRISREIQTDEGIARTLAEVEVLVAQEPRHGRRYYLDIDPSRGSPLRDPGGILVSDYESGDDVAMYEGHIGSYGLGVLAAGLARQYNNAIVDPESNSGWAEGVLRGLADSGYGNIARTQRMLQPGQMETRLGFETTAQTRPAMMAEVQSWIEAHALGKPYALCPFPRVIRTLMDTILDERDKPVAAPGYHDEFLILKGQSLRKTRPRHPDPLRARAVEAAARKEPPREKSLREMMGLVDRSGRAITPTERPAPSRFRKRPRV